MLDDAKDMVDEGKNMLEEGKGYVSDAKDLASSAGDLAGSKISSVTGPSALFVIGCFRSGHRKTGRFG